MALIGQGAPPECDRPRLRPMGDDDCTRCVGRYRQTTSPVGLGRIPCSLCSACGAVAGGIGGICPVIAFCSLFKLISHRFKFRFRQSFNSHQFVSRFRHPDQFIQFQLKSRALPVLCILNQKHHQERYDAADGIHHQLPGVRKMEERPGQQPPGDKQAGDAEGPRTSAAIRGVGCDFGEPVFAICHG